MDRDVEMEAVTDRNGGEHRAMVSGVDDDSTARHVKGRGGVRSSVTDNRYQGEAGIFETLDDGDDDVPASLSDPNRPLKCMLFAFEDFFKVF